MTAYVIRRLIQLIPILLGASIVVFLMMRLLPGDPALQALGGAAASEVTGEQVEALREEWGLNDPLPIQYVHWLTHAAQGDFGRSTISRVPASDEILNRFPATLQLTIAALVVSIVLGILAGLLAAIKHNTMTDRISTIIALLGICTPSFWLGLMLMLLFSVKLGWFPTFGKGGIEHLVLPGITLGMGGAGVIARVTRSSMLEVMSDDYIRTARSKGLRETTIMYRHALKNALIPIITLVGLEFGFLLSGSVVTETVFSFPGIGLLLITSINNRDFPIVQGVILLFALQFVVVNLIVDLIYAWVDPRIAYS